MRFADGAALLRTLREVPVPGKPGANRPGRKGFLDQAEYLEEQLRLGRLSMAERADLTVLNYEIVDAHRQTLARRGLKALVADESHYVKNPHAKRTQAVRRLAEAVAPDGLRLALTGTPVLNHAEELIAQLRVIGRMHEFGSGASFRRQFDGELNEERLHWHLRRHCFVRRLKSEVIPQLPAKRQVVVPVTLTNEAEYRLAEDDVIEWLRSQPLDLSTLDAKIAATLRAERLAQLTTLQRLAARGKLAAGIAWIHDFLNSGEPLVVFGRHVEVQRAVLRRFPHALHLLGEDSIAAREQAIAAFQQEGGPQLIVCATRVAAQGITLTRASNVAFLELDGAMTDFGVQGFGEATVIFFGAFYVGDVHTRRVKEKNLAVFIENGVHDEVDQSLGSEYYRDAGFCGRC